MDKLRTTIEHHPEGFIATAELIENTVLPTAIFLYENTGSAVLGDYLAVARAEDLQSRQIWSGVAIPTFGNKYVRHTSVRKVFPDQQTAISFIDNTKSAALRLKNEVAAIPTISQITVL